MKRIIRLILAVLTTATMMAMFSITSQAYETKEVYLDPDNPEKDGVKAEGNWTVCTGYVDNNFTISVPKDCALTYIKYYLSSSSWFFEGKSSKYDVEYNLAPFIKPNEYNLAMRNWLNPDVKESDVNIPLQYNLRSLNVCGTSSRYNYQHVNGVTVKYHVHQGLENGVCSECGTPCGHNFENSVCTFCGYKCVQHEWENGACIHCEVKCEHEWEKGVCKICGYKCSHEWTYDESCCCLCGVAPGLYDNNVISIENFDQLKKVIDGLKNGDEKFLSIKNDIDYKGEIKINASNVKLHIFGAPTKEYMNLNLGSYCGFYIDAKNVELCFDKIHICGNNTAKAISYGQGIYVNKENCTIKNGIFEDCYVDGDGGAIYVYEEYCTIEHCFFEDCSASVDGGAICIDDDNCTINKCTFKNCKVDDDGGAIYMCYNDSDGLVVDCSFSGCDSGDCGKNICGWNDIIAVQPDPFDKDETYYCDCELLTHEEYEEKYGSLVGSTLSKGNTWILAGIGVVAIVAIAVVVAKKKKTVTE